jgi:hypothetical protein
MALEGTHIRFALDMKDKYQVTDLGKYLSGAVYPDSRYTTGVVRAITHPKDFLNWDVLKLDDFRKGWYVHLLYDKLQSDIMLRDIPQVLEKGSEGLEYWYRISAIKTLQDIDDIQKFDLRSYLHYLDYVENPNGEDIEEVRRYNQNFQKAYLNPPSIENSIQMWLLLGVSKEREDKVQEWSIIYSQDEKVMQAVRKLYDETLKIA